MRRVLLFGTMLLALGTARGEAAAPPGTLTSCPVPGATLRDRTHRSRVFGEERHYRIFLPADYDAVKTRYPVIYYFHGSGDRYTLEDYDQGKDTVPKICAFVASHAAIVVAVDGFIAANYKEFYGGAPYDIRRGGGRVDFGEYFLELVDFIDANYRTLKDREHRATSGLSMGGFMSLYLAARYPQTIGSCSAFNPGPEFYVGEKDRLSLWRPKDFVAELAHTPVRLVRASGDYIGQYTDETRAAFAAAPAGTFEFRQDEYHRHWATSITETFEFHLRAFADATLDRVPQQWSYASAFDHFDAWGYHGTADISGPAILSLDEVRASGFFLHTRQWAPDGPAAACSRIEIQTAGLYTPGAAYRIADYSLRNGTSSVHTITADGQGRLRIASDCSGHEIGISGPGVATGPVVLLPETASDFLRPLPGRPATIPVRLWNPGTEAVRDLRITLSSAYPTATILHGTATMKELAAGQMVDLSPELQVEFTAGDGEFARTRLSLDIAGQHTPTLHRHIYVMVAPADMHAPKEMAVLDGRMETFPLFWQGVHGGGESVRRIVTEGKGDGNGVLEPGEQATVWVRLDQGLDPFDKENWCRAKVYSESPWLKDVGDIQQDKRREWTSAQSRTSVVALRLDTPRGARITAILDCEAYSFRWTPDVRYGAERLYQPFQLHRHYLFLWDWTVGVPSASMHRVSTGSGSSDCRYVPRRQSQGSSSSGPLPGTR